MSYGADEECRTCCQGAVTWLREVKMVVAYFRRPAGLRLKAAKAGKEEEKKKVGRVGRFVKRESFFSRQQRKAGVLCKQ